MDHPTPTIEQRCTAALKRLKSAIAKSTGQHLRAMRKAWAAYSFEQAAWEHSTRESAKAAKARPTQARPTVRTAEQNARLIDTINQVQAKTFAHINGQIAKHQATTQSQPTGQQGGAA